MSQKNEPQKNERLRKARKNRNWTQATLAEKLGVSDATVRSWEAGNRSPSLDAREHLCTLFAMTPVELGLEEPSEEIQVPDKAPSPAVIPNIARPSTDKARQRMLRRVRATWIDSVFKQSLHQAALIALGLQEQPDALANPWHLEVQETNLPSYPLPAGISMTQVYDDANGELLILGEPGGGKTTLLLGLARDLLDRAEQDEEQPMPVVFNLSSWATKQLPLEDWIVEELNIKYRVPHKLGQKWATNEQLALLLDGLDEVSETARPVCVKAINAYQQEHAITPLVVCCRRLEYFAQATRVALQRAVLVQPLTLPQIDQYLSSAGSQLEGIRQALEEDSELQEMVKTPLMLSIVTLAYQGEARKVLVASGSIEARRREIFETYVRRMLSRRRAETRYDFQQVFIWLVWLAQQLAQRSQTEFYLERMQPDWLNSNLRERYHRTCFRLVFGIENIIVGALFSWLRGGSQGNAYGVNIGLLGMLSGGHSGPGNTLLGWMAPGLGGGLAGGGSLGIIILLVTVLVTLMVSSPPTFSVQAVRHGLSNGLRTGCITGGIIGMITTLMFSLTFGVSQGVYLGLGMALFTGLLIGLMAGLIAGLRYEKRSVTQRRRVVDRLLDGLAIGLCAGLGFGVVNALLIMTVDRSVIVYTLVVICFYGIAFGVGDASNLIPNVGREVKPAETVAWSWDSVRRNFAPNLWQALGLSIVVTVCVMVILGGASAIYSGPAYGFRYGLIYGLIIGAIVGVAAIFTGVLTSGWSSDMLSEDQLFRPNEGIRRSLKNAVFAACLFGPLGGLASGIVCGLAFGLVGGLPSWPVLAGGFALVLGTFFALTFVMLHGSIACIEHYTLRWYLWRSGSLPWKAITFLDYAAERILLRKVGAGYIFAHRLLLEYFVTSAEQATKKYISEREKSTNLLEA